MLKLAIVSFLVFSIQGLKLSDHFNAAAAYRQKLEKDRAERNNPQLLQARLKAEFQEAKKSQAEYFQREATKNVAKKYAWYTVDSQPPIDRLCNTNLECDGLRQCGHIRCQGQPRPKKDPEYIYDESITQGKCPSSPLEKNYRVRDYYCNQVRKCGANGMCQGATEKGPDYQVQEVLGSRCPFGNDSNIARKDLYCDGARTCSEFGFCQGKAR